jgi:hypothetical protein
MLTWNNAAEVAAKPARSSGDLVFVKASDCPISCVPLQLPLVGFSQVFDANLKKCRAPQTGEKSQRRFLFNAADQDGNIKAYCTGAQVIEGIGKVLATAAKLGRSQVGIKITASGSGVDTVYSVELDLDLTANIGEGFGKGQPHDLEKLRDSLLGIKAQAVTAAAPANAETIAAMMGVPASMVTPMTEDAPF